MSHLSNVWFKVTDLEVASGRGCRVTTVDGHEYLDFAAGIAVNSTGHCHPKVTAAIAAQAERFLHAQVNVFTHDLLEPLARRLGHEEAVEHEGNGCQGGEARGAVHGKCALRALRPARALPRPLRGTSSPAKAAYR